MALPEQFLTELVERNDIESVISSYVSLKSRGKIKVGLCPFHGEKTASFTVYPDTSSFYCFGCGAGGDVITFIKKIENLDYLDAVKFLAERSGLKMPEDNHMNDAVSKLRVRVLEANREAARFFHQTLYSPEGKEALEYFYKRGYSDKTIRHFGLGFAPNDFHALQNALRQKGFNDEELVAAFLCKKGTKGAYDTFRNRVMVPIIDIRGNVIAFGGRVLDDSKPKYVNTSDTLAFKKSRNLFALNFAKEYGAEELILCEGYMDVIAMHQAGFTNAVAALGTSFTAEHATLLSRYTKSVVLLFDSDEAGQKAAKRAIDILRPTGLNIRVVAVPDGKDPDEFIKKNGADRFKLVLQKSASDVEYKLLDIAKQYDISSAAGKSEFLAEAAKLLATLENKIEIDVYAGKLAKDSGVQKTSVLDQVEYYKQRNFRAKNRSQMGEIVRKETKTLMNVNPDAKLYQKATNAEEKLLGLLLLHPNYMEKAKELVSPEQFATSFNRKVYTQLIERIDKNLSIELSFLSSEYEDNEMSYITKMQHNAQMLSGTMEEVRQFANVIVEEYNIRGTAHPETMSDEEIMAYLEKKKKQQGGT